LLLLLVSFPPVKLRQPRDGHLRASILDFSPEKKSLLNARCQSSSGQPTPVR
jgi:hypothetical protein